MQFALIVGDEFDRAIVQKMIGFKLRFASIIGDEFNQEDFDLTRTGL